MILLHLKGGIGNQMFEYAAGKAFLLHQNTIFKIDKSYYDQKHYEQEGSLNDFYHIPSFRDSLKNFEITAKDATNEEINRFRQNYLNKVLDRFKPNHLRKKYIQPHVGFDTNFYRIKDNTLIKGYFQSEKYFSWQVGKPGMKVILWHIQWAGGIKIIEHFVAGIRQGCDCRILCEIMQMAESITRANQVISQHSHDRNFQRDVKNEMC